MAVGPDEFQMKAVGPYLLQKTLGKGQTGRFRLVTLAIFLLFTFRLYLFVLLSFSFS